MVSTARPDRGGFVTPDHPSRAELSSCVHCGLCLPHCPTFRLTGREAASPRGRLSAMSAVLEGGAPLDEEFDEAMSFCLGCRACEAVCPSLVPFGRAMEGARAELGVQRPTAGRRLRRLLLGRLLTLPLLVDSVGRAAGTARRLRVERVLPGRAARSLAGLRQPARRGRSWRGREVDPVGPTRGTVALLAGCVMDGWFRPVHDATVDVLRRAGYRVVVPAGQTCCGALAAHDGHAGVARRLARRNIQALADADLVVANAAGCSAHLKGYGHWAEGGEELAGRARDVTEVVASLIEQGVLPSFEESRGDRVAVQDPCHLRHAQRIVSHPRRIVRAAGYTPVDIDPDGLCCGAAGIYSLLHPETSAELGRRKAAQVEASGAMLVASANPGCEMQLRAHLGGAHRIVHPIELYRETLAADRDLYAARP